MKLVIGTLNYSSWSLRAWLALEHAGAPFEMHEVTLYDEGDPMWKDRIRAFSGAGKVPVLVDGSLTVHEALAICEYANERFPHAGLWPEDRALRARARAISTEMATDYAHLRAEMGMNHRARVTGFEPSAGAQAEIERAFEIWSASLQSSGGPFLFGHFTIADCMYVPLLSRFQTYGVELAPDAAAYAKAIWQQPCVARWVELTPQAAALPLIDETMPANTVLRA